MRGTDNNGRLALLKISLLLKTCITGITELYNTITGKYWSMMCTCRLLKNTNIKFDTRCRNVMQLLDVSNTKARKECILKLTIQKTKLYMSLNKEIMWYSTFNWMAVSTNASSGFGKMHAGNISFHGLKLGTFQKAVEVKLPPQHTQDTQHDRGKTLNRRTNLPHGEREEAY